MWVPEFPVFMCCASSTPHPNTPAAPRAKHDVRPPILPRDVLDQLPQDHIHLTAAAALTGSFNVGKGSRPPQSHPCPVTSLSCDLYPYSVGPGAAWGP
ncbi:hypothetical protein BJV78DRAFT_254218 [Lactifluus subvellereus]|nr:hypothetical protein BJV78DRAFT_254218 [Lactifluus subvellereus]